MSTTTSPETDVAAQSPTAASAPTNGVTRRHALALAGLSAGALTVAACGSSSGASAPSSSSSPAAADAGTGAGPVATLDKITVGGAISATDSTGKPIIVARPTSTTAVAFSAICTHQGCTVNPSGGQLDCPCHGSVYNAMTGAVENGPAERPLPPVSVTVKNGSVFLG